MLRESIKIISICGLARAGKDTTAKYFTDTYGFIRKGYADKLKELALYLNLWDGMEENKREPLVKLGAGARNILYPSIWVDAVWKNQEFLNQIIVKGNRFCLSDNRYKNELTAAQAFADEEGLGHISIWIDRPGVEPQGEEKEKTLPLRRLVDYIIVNDGTIEDLYQKLSEVG